MNGVRQRWSVLPAVVPWGAGAVVVVLLVVVVLGLLSGSDRDDYGDGKATGAAPTPGGAASPSPTPGGAASPSPTPSLPESPTNESPLGGIGDTSAADEYAVSIARVVLGTNPRDHNRDDYLALLLGEVTDEAVGESRDRVEPVIEAALPDEYQWRRQRDYGQVNTFQVEHVWEPDEVGDVRDEIPAGYAVRTVAGTQATRYLDENGDRARSSMPRLLTVFAYCPDGGSCSLVSIPQEVLR